MAFLRDSIECKKKSCNKEMALNIQLGNKNPSSFSLLYCNLCVNFIFLSFLSDFSCTSSLFVRVYLYGKFFYVVRMKIMKIMSAELFHFICSLSFTRLGIYLWDYWGFWWIGLMIMFLIKLGLNCTNFGEINGY